MVVSHKMIVKIIAISFLFLIKSIEIAFPKIAPINDTTMIMIELLGVLSKISTPISSIFCTIAVEIARNVPIGSSNRTYFFVILRIFGSDSLSVCANGFV